MTNPLILPYPQVIALSQGAVEYTYEQTLTELTGKNITADTVKMAIGSQGTATTYSAWVTPDVVSTGTITAREFMLANPGVPGVEVPDGTDPANFTLYQITAQLLIGADTINHAAISPAPGLVVYAYLQATDSPEIVVRRGAPITIT